MASASHKLAEALTEHSDFLQRVVARSAGSLLRYESLDDLAQGASLRALERQSTFEWRGEGEFCKWIAVVAESYMQDRRAYWNAARRSAGRQLRVYIGGDTATRVGAVELQSSRTGPATLADRKEQLRLATLALALLLDRDQSILALDRAGESLDRVADSLGLTIDAAGKARQRARVRFQRAFELIQRSG